MGEDAAQQRRSSGSRAVPEAGPLAAEGACQALATGLGEAYLGAFALFLGAGGLALGAVATLPTAATAAAQALARRLLPGSIRIRRILLGSWVLQACGYAALGLCLLPSYPWSVVALAACAFVAWGIGGLAVPAWSSLVSAVVPRDRLGWFFGTRGSAQQLGTLAAILGGGMALSLLTRHGHEALGFAVIFAGAGLARLSGTLFLARVPEKERVPHDRRLGGGLGALLATVKVRRLASYLWMAHFATQVSSPFFVPYMLRGLGYPYVLVGALIAVPAIVKVLTMRFWGRVADRVGPGPLLRSAGWLTALVPLPWLFSKSPWWILVAQVYSGLAWGAFELAQASSLLQTLRGRERQIALFNTVDGAMMIGGALLGGLVVNLYDGPGGAGYLAAMALSIVWRLIPALALLWRVRGIGRPAWSHAGLPMFVSSVRPTRGFTLSPLPGGPPRGRRAPAADHRGDPAGEASGASTAAGRVASSGGRMAAPDAVPSSPVR